MQHVTVNIDGGDAMDLTCVHDAVVAKRLAANILYIYIYLTKASGL